MIKHIIFIWIRASWKSTLWEKVANKIWANFYDIDKEIIKWIWAQSMLEVIKTLWKEWLAKKEHELLVDLLKSDKRIVISTWGRSFSHDFPKIKNKNKELVFHYWITILPICTNKELWKRIICDRSKEHAHLNIQRLKDNFEESLSFLREYKQIADIEIITDERTSAESVDEVLEKLKDYKVSKVLE